MVEFSLPALPTLPAQNFLSRVRATTSQSLEEEATTTVTATVDENIPESRGQTEVELPPGEESADRESSLKPASATLDFLRKIGDNWLSSERQLKQMQSGEFAKYSSNEVYSFVESGEAFDLTASAIKQLPGYCMIMNQSVGHEDSESDLACLRFLFQSQLGMFVKELRDSTADQFKKQLVSLINSERINDYACLVLFLMACGNENRLTMSGNTELDFNADVLKVLGEAPLLKDKPTLVFVQVCETPIPAGSSANNSPGRMGKSTGDIPKVNELFVLRSTYLQEHTTRHMVNGPLFIKAWCEVVKRCAHEADLMCIVERVTALMHQSSPDHTTEVPTISYSNLSRKFFFPSIARDSWAVDSR